jgi:autotransporter-associated beta strand protein
LTQNGGTNTITGGNGMLWVGYNSGSTGVYALSDTGRLSVSGTADVGYAGSGTFTQTGGTNTISGSLCLGYSAGSSGTYNLSGGLLVVPQVSSGAGSYAFNFSGGTLQAAGPFSTSLPIALNAGGGNGTLNTAGYSVTLSGSLSGPGGLTKIGSGALTLAGSGAYAGGTTISQGKLAVNGLPATLATSGNDLVLTVAPEPSALALLGAAAVGLLACGWRRRLRKVKTCVVLVCFFCAGGFAQAANFFISNYSNNTIEKIASNGTESVFANSGMSGPDFIAVQSPEPGSIALLLAGALALGIWRLRRNA